jgi:hypothetical protein
MWVKLGKYEENLGKNWGKSLETLGICEDFTK